jgi:thymidylate synthase (FAD)
MTIERSKEFGFEIIKKEDSLPYIDSQVFHTKNGTPYLKSPGVALIGMPNVNLNGIKAFLEKFPEDYHFLEYLNDPVSLSPAETLSKFAGQVCYMSMGPDRTENKDADKYFRKIVQSSHGSIFEHAMFNFFIWGDSRSFTHELVRHRAGAAFSHISQRYVSGKVLRFVERPEYQNDSYLHQMFEEDIDYLSSRYEAISEHLYQKQAQGMQILTAEGKTELRKKVQQAARSRLPNETEAPIVFSANLRALRHISNMRASGDAEIEIRRVAFYAFNIAKDFVSNVFRDFETVTLPDGTFAVKTDYPKV